MTKPNRIFVEADTSERQPQPVSNKHSHRDKERRVLITWLLVLAVLVVLLILVGGMTRLTDSGLSIAEWRPISGIIPPLSPADWTVEFENYKSVPEYTLQNHSMDLAEFKTIFWWEWGHRTLARIVGLVWAAGFLWLLLHSSLSRKWKTRALLVGALGGLQGVIGWWMVVSGLTGEVVDVAPYRLAIHSGLAFAILGLLVWYYLLARQSEVDLYKARRRQDNRLSRMSTLLMALFFAQVVMGALVAGTDAGQVYTDWPLMNGELLPSASFEYSPVWRNFFENPALVQFNHRMVAYLILVCIVIVWLRGRSSLFDNIRNSVTLAAIVILGQVILGIATVMSGAIWHGAILHQFAAMVTLYAIVKLQFVTRFPRAPSIRSSS